MNMSNESIVYLTSKLWEYSKGRRFYIVIFISFYIISNLIDFLQPLILAKIINIIQSEGVNESNIYLILGLVVLIVIIDLLFWVFHGFGRYFENLNSFYLNINYRKRIFGGVLELPAKWHNDNQSGDTIDKIEKSSKGIYDFSGQVFLIVGTIVRLITSIGAIIYFNIYSIFAIVFLLIFATITIVKMDKVLKAQYDQLYKYENTIASKIFDSISNITTITILKIEKLILDDVLKTLHKPFALFKKNITFNEIKWFLVSMIASVFLVFVLGGYILTNYINEQVIMVGTLSALFIYATRVNDVFFQFAWQYEELLRFKTSVQNANPLVDEIKENNNSKVIPHIKSDWKNINIKNLIFSYDENNNHTELNNISFEIKKGERVAIIGESGSGKTTFLKLLRGLYDTNEYEMFLDDMKIEHGIGAINNMTMLIPQEPEIFATTIKENITMGINHKISYIKKFCDMATITKVIDRLPNKWDSKVNEKGVNLSGGEKQRLALARALLASNDKEILLMDESTSSVDTKNELVIYKNVFREFKEKTIIATIHKYYLLPMFDRIVLFDNGKVITSGTFEELMENSEMFKDLWEKYKDIKD